MYSEVTGRWEDLVNRKEFRGHQVRVVILDAETTTTDSSDEWLRSLRRLAEGGVRITRPANDSREAIYDGD